MGKDHDLKIVGDLILDNADALTDTDFGLNPEAAGSASRLERVAKVLRRKQLVLEFSGVIDSQSMLTQRVKISIELSNIKSIELIEPTDEKKLRHTIVVEVLAPSECGIGFQGFDKKKKVRTKCHWLPAGSPMLVHLPWVQRSTSSYSFRFTVSNTPTRVQKLLLAIKDPEGTKKRPAREDDQEEGVASALKKQKNDAEHVMAQHGMSSHPMQEHSLQEHSLQGHALHEPTLHSHSLVQEHSLQPHTLHHEQALVHQEHSLQPHALQPHNHGVHEEEIDDDEDEDREEIGEDLSV